MIIKSTDASIDVHGKTVLAPMAGVNCTSFRIMCKNYGASLLFTQMYDVNTIVEKHKEGTLGDFLNILKQESPIAIQLIGNVNDPWQNAVKLVEKYADIVDINLGCIEDDFLGKKSGCYLMQHPDHIRKIAKMCVSATKKPVTAKIRSGWDDNSINAVEVATLLEQEGIAAITVHPRTRMQKYGGKANWKIIGEVKKAVSVPVIGSGDITLPGHAKAMFEQTKCDAVMIGREARNNPQIFEYVSYILENGKNKEIPEKDSRRLVSEFVSLYEKYEKRSSLNEVKDHCIWLLRKGNVFLKKRIEQAKSIPEIVKLAEINKS